MFFGNINYVTVAIATVAGLLLGYAWHAQWAFGKLWMKHKSWSDESLHAKRAKSPMWRVNLVTAASLFVTALVLSALFNSLIVTTVCGILWLALLVWAAFSLPMKLYDYLYGGDSFAFMCLSSAFQLVAVAIMALIIGLWG